MVMPLTFSIIKLPAILLFKAELRSMPDTGLEDAVFLEIVLLSVM